MNLQNFRLYDKSGSPINWLPSPYIPLNFNSASGHGAEGFLITDVSGIVTSAEITNGGYLYDNDDINVSYIDSYTNISYALTSADVSIIKSDVSIFNPDPVNTKCITSLVTNISTNFIYPSVTYAGAIFLKPVSQGLIETEHIFIFEDSSIGYIRPFDAINNKLIVRMVGNESEIKFFEVNENTQEITWADELVFDVSLNIAEIPLQINIGFKSDVEGVFERIVRIYHQVGNDLYTLGDIAVNGESIGEDERHRTLLSNFGLPDPKDITKLFKETDINEDNPDWKILNYKSKHMILEHDKIMPYVGTYKGLINAIKWLGYDDIYFREWFLNTTDNRTVSFVVPFNAIDRTQTMLMFTPEQRKKYKKLNYLSLNYCLTREIGINDDKGMPITENCYTYNLKEVYVKLLGLKQWLEKNIIGVNCKITDITGDGIYFERIQNIVYATDNVGYEYKINQTLTPKSISPISELIHGDASIKLTFLELDKTAFNNLSCRFIDMMEYAWTPNDASHFYSIEDSSYLADPSSFVHGGATFAYPFKNISDIQWRTSVSNQYSVIGDNLVTAPLFIYENEIRFYNLYDTSTIFYDASTKLTILLEKAYLRDPSIDEWTNSIAYSIYPADPCSGFDYTIESSGGSMQYVNGYVTLVPANASSKLQYAYDVNYKVPLLSIQNFKFRDASNNVIILNKEYYLDILDGKIRMYAGMTESSSNLTVYLNWNYDASLVEQSIELSHIYESERMKLWQIDVSNYYWSDPCIYTGGNSSLNIINDNSTYTMMINYIGEYQIELFAWDSYNTLLYNKSNNTCKVYTKSPIIYSLYDVSMHMNSISNKYLSVNDISALLYSDRYPLYDRYIPLQGLSIIYDSNGLPYVSIPSITYFQDVPETNTLNKFFNLTERVLNIDVSTLTITIDSDYQKFYVGDDIKLVKVDKGKYSLIEECSSHIVASGLLLTEFELDQIPSSIIIDSSSDIYILNNTYRITTNISNINGKLTLDVSGYAFSNNQLVAIIVTDLCTNYSSGASYRVTSVDGSTHVFDKEFPTEFMNSHYKVEAKHAFSTYAEFNMLTNLASELNNEFRIYLKDSYYQENYLDNTFIYMNIPFDQDKINTLWYDSSLNVIDVSLYYYKNNITLDNSTMSIFVAEYDNSLYMLNQKNIWTIRSNDTSALFCRVFNKALPITVQDVCTYNIVVESYDKYGNLVSPDPFILKIVE